MLDDTQRTVVEDAAEYPLTVATGPAGTGKTQVVVAALTSVLCAGGTALFASRNHQAVNLVEARMAELVGRPVLMRAGLRAGRRDLRRAMIEALKSLLSGTTPTCGRRTASRPKDLPVGRSASNRPVGEDRPAGRAVRGGAPRGHGAAPEPGAHRGPDV